jgi:putative endonuclease
MPRLGRGIHAFIFLATGKAIADASAMQGAWTYIVINKPNGIIYVGVTSDIRRRAWEHREGVVDGFTKKYGLKQLVYVEVHERIDEAIRREKTLKRWPRGWKVRLINTVNPDWNDLYNTLNA